MSLQYATPLIVLLVVAYLMRVSYRTLKKAGFNMKINLGMNDRTKADLLVSLVIYNIVFWCAYAFQGYLN